MIFLISYLNWVQILIRQADSNEHHYPSLLGIIKLKSYESFWNILLLRSTWKMTEVVLHCIMLYGELQVVELDLNKVYRD